MWKWAVKRKKNKQEGWWEDGGGTKGIWGKEVNWEHQIMMDSTEIFWYVIMYSLLPYLEVLFLERNLKRCLKEEWEPQVTERRNLFWSFSPWLVDQENNPWQVWSLEVFHTIKYPVPVIYKTTTPHIRFKALVAHFPEERWPVALPMACGSPGPAALSVSAWVSLCSLWLGASLGWAHTGWEKAAEQPKLPQRRRWWLKNYRKNPVNPQDSGWAGKRLWIPAALSIPLWLGLAGCCSLPTHPGLLTPTLCALGGFFCLISQGNEAFATSLTFFSPFLSMAIP